MVYCSSNHHDLQLILNQGFKFIKQNLEWFTQLIYGLTYINRATRQDIKWLKACCFLKKLNNRNHVKGISTEHLAEFREDLPQNNLCTLLISVTWISKTINIFFIKEDYLIKWIKLFINWTNSTNYYGTFQLTFTPNILIETILYMIQRSNHEQTLYSVFYQVMSTIPCDLTKDLSLTSNIWQFKGI